MTQIQKNNEPKQTLLTYIWSFKVAKRVQVGGCWLESTPHHPPFLATFVGIQLSVSMLWLWAALKSNRLHLYFILFTLLHMIFFSCNFLLVWEVGVLRREKDWPIFTWQVKSWTQNITSSILQIFFFVIPKLHVLPVHGHNFRLTCAASFWGIQSLKPFFLVHFLDAIASLELGNDCMSVGLS